MNAEDILQKIDGIYPRYKHREKLKKLLKKVIEAKFEEKEEDIINVNDYILHYGKRTKSHWYEGVYEYLYDVGKLPLAVNFKKNEAIEEQFDFNFSLLLDKPEAFVRLTSKRKKQHEKDKEEEEVKKLQDEFHKDYSLEELVTIYKGNEEKYKELDEHYQSLRDALQTAMNKEGIQKITPKGDTCFSSVSLNVKKPTYSLSKLLEQDKIIQNVHFQYLILEDGSIECIDVRNNKTITFQDTHFYKGMMLSVKNGKLWVDDTKLHTDLRSIFNGKQHNDATGIIEREPTDLLFYYPISSTKIEEMYDRARIKPKEIEPFKYIQSENDLSTFFEIISEESHRKRREMFHDRIGRRGKMFKKKGLVV